MTFNISIVHHAGIQMIFLTFYHVLIGFIYSILTCNATETLTNFWFGLVVLYGISTLAGYLMPNPVYTYILYI